MAVFAYSGTDESRTAIKGTVAADTPRQARDVLRSKGVQVNKLSEFVPRANASPLSMLTLGRARNQWNTAIHELSMLLHAGIPLLEALDTIAEGRGLSGVFRTAMLEVRDRVAAGASFAEALAQRPDLFDATSVHLVEVGENAGTLEHVLSQLAEFKLRSMQFKDQVFTAMMYPVFLMCFGTAAAIFLMTAVMPPLLENLQETLDTLPWPTQVAQALSNLLVNYGFLIAVASAAGLFALVVYVRTPGGQQQWHRTLLRIPVLGPMAVKQSVSRIAMVIATLSRSGVVLTKAVDLAARSTDNVIIRQALEDCGKAMGAGEDISAALNRSGILPPLAVRVFSVGQESGQLDEMLERLATDYERQLASTSARITALLEPMLILVLAAFVGFLLLATILPILEAGSVMN